MDNAGRMVITWLPKKAPRLQIPAATVLRIWKMGRELEDLPDQRRQLAVQLLRLVRFEEVELGALGEDRCGAFTGAPPIGGGGVDRGG